MGRSYKTRLKLKYHYSTFRVCFFISLLSIIWNLIPEDRQKVAMFDGCVGVKNVSLWSVFFNPQCPVASGHPTFSGGPRKEGKLLHFDTFVQTLEYLLQRGDRFWFVGDYRSPFREKDRDKLLWRLKFGIPDFASSETIFQHSVILGWNVQRLNTFKKLVANNML